MLLKFEINQTLAKLRVVNAAAMYALIIVIGVLSPVTNSAIGVTSQTVGKFETLEHCKEAAGQPLTGGVISDLSISKEISWYCVYAGKK